jgi:ribosomal protein L14
MLKSAMSLFSQFKKLNHESSKEERCFESGCCSTAKAIRRKDGSYIRFDENAVVIVTKAKKEYNAVGTRVFGPIPREISEKGFQTVTSLAPEVL